MPTEHNIARYNASSPSESYVPEPSEESACTTAPGKKQATRRSRRVLLNDLEISAKVLADETVDAIGFGEVQLAVLDAQALEQLLALLQVQQVLRVDEADEELAEHPALLHGLCELEVCPEAWRWQAGRKNARDADQFTHAARQGPTHGHGRQVHMGAPGHERQCGDLAEAQLLLQGRAQNQIGAAQSSDTRLYPELAWAALVVARARPTGPTYATTGIFIEARRHPTHHGPKDCAPLLRF